MSDWCTEFCNHVRKILPCVPNVYLIGNTIVLACTREDLIETFRAISEPPYVPADKWRPHLKRRPGIAVRDREVCIVDIASYDAALALAQKLAYELRPEMPFKVKQIDLVLTYRSSEDGGLFTRIMIRVVFSQLASQEDVEKLLNKIRRVIDEVVEETSVY